MVTDLRRRRSAPGDGVREPFNLSLLGEFALRRGQEKVPLVHNAARLVAFLALHGTWVRRSYVAGTLWEDTSEERAHGNLRSALWKVKKTGLQVVDREHDELRLAPEIDIDYQRSDAAARRLLEGRFGDASADLADARWWGELLPGWYDDWVLLERERHDQLLVLALEALAEHCTDAGNIDIAVLAALAAVERAPLRESAQRALVRAYLVGGNVADALNRCRLYEKILFENLGIAPSPQMIALFDGLAAP